MCVQSRYGTNLVEKEKSRVKKYAKMYAGWAERCNVVSVEKLVKSARIDDYPTFNKT